MERGGRARTAGERPGSRPPRGARPAVPVPGAPKPRPARPPRSAPLLCGPAGARRCRRFVPGPPRGDKGGRAPPCPRFSVSLGREMRCGNAFIAGRARQRASISQPSCCSRLSPVPPRSPGAAARAGAPRPRRLGGDSLLPAPALPSRSRDKSLDCRALCFAFSLCSGSWRCSPGKSPVGAGGTGQPRYRAAGPACGALQLRWGWGSVRMRVKT